MKTIRNNQGFSIIEALAGLSVIATLALVVTQFGVVRKVSKTAKMNTSCLSIAKSVIEKVKDASVSGRIRTYIPNEGPLFSEDPVDNLDGRINNGDQWQNINIATAPFISNIGGSNYEHNSYLLISSSIRVLTSIYNSDNAFCNQWRAYAPLTSVDTDPANAGGANYVAGDIAKEGNPVITIKSSPYDLNTGNPVCGLGTIYIKPRSSNAVVAPVPPLTMTPDPIFTREDLGMRLGVQVSYTENGENRTCEASHDFQYSPDVNPPEVTFFEVSKNEYNSGVQNPNVAANICQPGLPTVTNNVTVMLGIENNDLEEGTLYFCRDTSTPLTYVQDPTAPAPAIPNGGNKACIDPSVSVVAPVRYSTGPYVPPGPPVTDPSTVGPTATAGVGLLGPGTWVPCHQVTLCGVAANGGATSRVNDRDPFNASAADAALNNSGDRTQRVVFRLEYTITSGGPAQQYCQYGMEVVAVDTAGNISAAVTLTDAASTPLGGPVISNVADPIDNAFVTARRQYVNDSLGNLDTGVNYDLISTNYSTNATAPPQCVTAGTLCFNEFPGDPNRAWDPLYANDPVYAAGYYTCDPRGCCVNTPLSGEPMCTPYTYPP